MKAALFASVGAIALSLPNISLPNLKGIGKHMPLTMAAFTISALSLIGIPGTVGFISKWYLVLAAVETGSTKGIIAATIHGSAGNASKITYAWKRNIHQLVEKIVHTIPAQCHHASDGLSLIHI